MTSGRCGGGPALGLAALLLVLPGRLAALDPGLAPAEYSVDQWSVAEGLPQNSITALVQDDAGYLWIGTLEGVARFDGARFLTRRDPVTEALPGEPVSSLALDAAPGRIWAGTLGLGLRHADVTHGEGGEPADALPDERVYALLADGERLWAGLGSGLVELEDGALRRAWGAAEGLDVPVVALARRGAELVLGTNRGPRRFDGESIAPLGDDEELAATAVRAVAPAADGGVWLGTVGLGLWKVDGTGTVRRGPELPNPFVASLVEHGGCLWAGTRGGLDRVCGGRVESFPEQHPLAGDAILALLVDREGGLWVGTQSRGLFRLRDPLVGSITRRNGLAPGIVSSVAETRDGRLLVATTGGGVTLFDRAGRRLGAIDRADGLPTDRVTAVIETSDGTIWIGTSGGGVAEVPPEGPLAVHTTASGALGTDFVFSLFEDRTGALWVGSSLAAVSRRDASGWTRWSAADGLPAAAVSAFAERRDGTVLAATQRGLVRLDRASGRWTEVAPVARSLLTAILVDADDRVWLGSLGGGLALVDGDAVRSVDSRQGLPSDTVWSILPDDEGRFWVSTNHGIFASRIDDLLAAARRERELPASRLFDDSDGMPSAECNGGTQPAGWRGADGRLFFPTLEGVAVVSPSALSRDETAVPVAVELVRANGRRLRPADGLRLAPGTRELEVDYTALTFRAPTRTRFRYRLRGLAGEWTEAGERRTAIFTNLRPGEYRFEVVASNADGAWIGPGAGLDLAIAPRFWETRWFVVSMVAFLVGLGGFGHAWRLRAVESRRRELEDEVAVRTRELAAANVQLAALAQQDGLTGIANRRQLDERLAAEWSRLGRAREPLALVLADLDGFKTFNDRQGHLAGDDALRRVAGELAALAHRPGDVAARYGGEELALLLPGTDLDGALHVAEEARRRVEELTIPHPAAPGGRAVLTISLGVAAVVPSAGATAESLVAEADRALYRAKAEGRNRVAAG